MIKCPSFEFGRENGQRSVMTHRDRCTRSVRHDLEPNIFLSGPPTQSISTYLHINLSLKKIKKKIWVNCIFATKLIRKFFNNVLLVHLRGLWRFRFIASSPLQPLQARPNLCLIAPQIFELVSSRQNIFLFWGKVTRDKNTHAILKRLAQRCTGANIKLWNKYVGHCIWICVVPMERPFY